MTILFRIWAMFILAAKRLLSQPGLALANLLGLISSATLIMSIPLYADAVYSRMLREELSGKALGEDRPPFTFTFHYVGAWAGSLQWDDVRAADTYLCGPVVSDLGLPHQLTVHSLKTDRFGLFPQDSINYTSIRAQIATVRFGCISELQEHITILEGSFPAVASSSPEGTVEVLLSESLAYEAGLQVGETYIAFASRGPNNIQIPVRIAGIWRATDPNERFWFRDPGSLHDVFLVPEETFLGRLSPQMKDEIYEALWYLVTDGTSIRTSDVGPLLGRITRVRTKVSVLLPRTIMTSPMKALERYQRSARLLTILLYAFSIPIIGLNLVFTGLVAGMSVEGRRREIAILRSRGATKSQVVGVAVIEGLVIGLLALALGLPAGRLVAQIAAKTRTFLNFTAHGDVQVTVTRATLRFGLAAIGFGLVTQVVPTLGAARHTIVTYKQERARTLRPPWWQRAGLDLLLLVPAAYGTYLLRQQGSLVLPVDGVTFSDPFQNPLLFLVPSLTVLALTLFIIRILPFIMTGLAWLASQTRSVGFLMATRQLSRTPGFYAAPLMLLVMTLSLSAFISSVAQTLDDYLYDQMRYRTGADMVLTHKVEFSETGEAEEGLFQPTESVKIPRWFYVPLLDYLQVPGVQHAARVGRFRASLALGDLTKNGIFMGVDRASFSQVAFWRQDFATESLGALMNALAIAHNGVLLPRSFMNEYALSVGDPLRVTVTAYRQETDLFLVIVGSFDLFSAWNPRWGPLFVGNLDYLFEQMGAELPASIWLTLKPTADPDQARANLYQLNPSSGIQQPLYEEITSAQQRPERQGLFGILSVGFATAALLTTLGFPLYAVFSFQRRSIELGTLRAIGLSSWQMTSYLAWEMTLLVLIGLAGGAGLGVMISELWIPYFRVGTEELIRVLPLSVRIAWPAIFGFYALFGLMLVAMLGFSVVVSRQLKLFDAVKLVEAA